VSANNSKNNVRDEPSRYTKPPGSAAILKPGLAEQDCLNARNVRAAQGLTGCIFLLADTLRGRWHQLSANRLRLAAARTGS